MKPTELIRIIVITIIGIALMLLGQPWLYRSDTIYVDVLDVEEWLATEYMTSSYCVLAAAITATILWSVLAARANPLMAKDTASWRLLWWIFLLVPILSIGVALWLQTEESTRTSLATLYAIDVLVLYWLPTASSSPSHTKYLPPGSMSLRNIFGS